MTDGTPVALAPSASLLATPQRSALLLGHDNELHVLVCMQAPEAVAPRRRPLHVALVLDRSGSMSGAPLDEVRRCARMVVEHLSADDRVALVAFDSRVDVLARLSALEAGGNRLALLDRIDAIRTGGSTDLHGGWLAGARLLAPHTSGDRMSRVLLLSDGAANQGLCDAAQIVAQCSALAEAGVTTSTYGLGRGFNEDLMLAMAQAGRGNGYYGESLSDLRRHFVAELELMDGLYAPGPRLALVPRPGVRLEVLSDLAIAPTGEYRLPDLAYGQVVEVLVKLRVDAALVSSAAVGEQVPLFSCSATYVDAGGVSCMVDGGTCSLPALPATAFSAVAENTLVALRIQDAAGAQLQRAGAAAARAGRWEDVDALVAQMQSEAVGNPELEANSLTLARLALTRDASGLSKRATYFSRSTMSRRSARGDILRALEEAQGRVPDAGPVADPQPPNDSSRPRDTGAGSEPEVVA